MIHARIQVRPATEDDLDSINEICNHQVADSHYTLDDEPMRMRRAAFGFKGIAHHTSRAQETNQRTHSSPVSDSPVEIAERPATRGPKARHHRKPETRHRHRGERKYAGVRNHRQVENHECTGEGSHERMDPRQA